MWLHFSPTYPNFLLKPKGSHHLVPFPLAIPHKPEYTQNTRQSNSTKRQEKTDNRIMSLYLYCHTYVLTIVHPIAKRRHLMARSRSIPTQLFWDPAFSLLDSDTQIILLGLTLIADDEGRGLAQTRFLVRQFDKDATLIEQALTTLTETGFLACYQIDNQRYYQHLHWQEWETLSKPTPSRYPAPHHHEDSGPSEIPQENSKKPREILPEEEGEERTEKRRG